MLGLVVPWLVVDTAGAGIFGDGDPANGVEDDRRTVSQGMGERPGDDWYRSGGTVYCDGAVRGSATILDLESLGAGDTGVVVATAAHVFYDLEQGRPWEQCAFHYLGLRSLPGYATPIGADALLMGDFDPAADPAAPAHGGGDWAFAWLGSAWRPPGGAAGLPPVTALEALGDERGAIGLLAWHRGAREISVSTGCYVQLSDAGDLGGGLWAGQLLDDCDSGDGASGGGLVVERAGRSAVVGVRGGEHWSRDAWPESRFPDGPPAGSRWDPAGYTNYARAFDHRLLAQLRHWVHELGLQSPGGREGSESSLIGHRSDGPSRGSVRQKAE